MIRTNVVALLALVPATASDMDCARRSKTVTLIMLAGMKPMEARPVERVVCPRGAC